MIYGYGRSFGRPFYLRFRSCARALFKIYFCCSSTTSYICSKPNYMYKNIFYHITFHARSRGETTELVSNRVIKDMHPYEWQISENARCMPDGGTYVVTWFTPITEAEYNLFQQGNETLEHINPVVS